MSGHNKWSQIQHKKGKTDKERSAVFTKLLAAISIAAKSEPKPDFNPHLRSAIEKAKESNVPQENIERAINRASEEKNLEEIVIEAYGPEKAAIIIEAITDNRNRTISEIRHLLDKNGVKMATQGSVLWSFDPPAGGRGEWKAKFPQQISDAAKQALQSLIQKLEEHNDVQRVITNAQ